MAKWKPLGIRVRGVTIYSTAEPPAHSKLEASRLVIVLPVILGITGSNWGLPGRYQCHH
jgi:hypothetical protein